MKKYSPNHPAVRYARQHGTGGHTIRERTQAVRERRGLTTSRRTYRNHAIVGSIILTISAGISNYPLQVTTITVGATIFVWSYSKMWR
jgi:ABC-type cobalamin transport system permease subunit